RSSTGDLPGRWRPRFNATCSTVTRWTPTTSGFDPWVNGSPSACSTGFGRGCEMQVGEAALLDSSVRRSVHVEVGVQRQMIGRSASQARAADAVVSKREVAAVE